MAPFEVSKEVVSALSDVQLRTLLRLLLEAEARQRRIALSAVSVGGDQSAPDAGVDGTIRWNGPPVPGGWLPRRSCYFQCKAQAMPPSAIRAEMRPGGDIRPVFGDMARARGAYIVFSTEDVSYAAHARRMEAMAESLDGFIGGGRIHLDFYGADRIARWANEHLGVATWILGLVGRSLSGWRPLGDWSAPGAAALPYLLDDSRRGMLRGAAVDMREALVAVRGMLAKPGGIVRLVGLSGMGKTRFAEALFDARVDPESVLPPELPIYGDAGLELATGASLLAEQLVMAQVAAVIVVDNCASRAHAQLAEIVARPESRCSLLTIDYDVEGDDGAGELVRLEGNSDHLISRLLRQRQPALQAGEYERLAHFSGGNARIALKVAEGARRGDLSQLRDGELLNRLFRSGRGEQERGLRRSAEIAALVYAFYVEGSDGHAAEHVELAAVGPIDGSVFYRHVATMLDWGIVQQRGPQRAVMPPALADMLAAPFVRRSEPARLIQQFAGGPPRLLASFARRIAALADEPAARRVAEALLAGGGPLGDFELPDTNALRGFLAVAPLAPALALEALERALLKVGRSRSLRIPGETWQELSRLLIAIASDDTLFERAALAGTALWGAASETDHRKVGPLVREVFRPAEASTRSGRDARLRSLDRLLGGDARERRFGLEAAGAMIDARYDWRHASTVELDLQSRGRWRADPAAEADWVAAVCGRICGLVSLDADLGPVVREVLCAALAGHSCRPTAGHVVAAMRAAKPAGFWLEGWHVVGGILTERPWGGRSIVDPAVYDLERELRPVSTDELFDAFARAQAPWTADALWGLVGGVRINPGYYRRFVRRQTAAGLLGRRFADEGVDIAGLMARSGGAPPDNGLRDFGVGFARASRDPGNVWRTACRAFASDHEPVEQIQILAGLVEGVAKRDGELAEAWLDQAAADPALAEHLVTLQLGLGLNQRAVQRIVGALSSSRLRPDQISLLVSGRNVGLVPEASRSRFLDLIYRDGDGVYPALALLCSYFYDLPEGVQPDRDMVRLAADFLRNPRTYADGSGGLPRAASSLATMLRTDDAFAAAVCSAILRARPDRPYVLPSFQVLGSLLAERHPGVVLEEVLATGPREDVIRIFFSGESLDSETALRWMEADPTARSVLVAKVAPMVDADRSGGVRWSPLALASIAAAPHPESVLRIFRHRVFSGSGNLTTRLVEFQALLTELRRHSDGRVRLWAQPALRRVAGQIQRADRSERAQLSRFE